MGDRLEFHRKRYSDGIMLILLSIAMAIGLVLLVRVPVVTFGGLFAKPDDAGLIGLAGGLSKTALAMALIGLAALIYWRTQRMLVAPPEIVIDEQGIHLRVGGHEQVLIWRNVVGLRIDTARGIRSLHVSPAPELVLGENTERLSGWMEIIITKGTINARFQDVIDTVKRVAPPHLAAQI